MTLTVGGRVKQALTTDTPIGVSFRRVGRDYDGGYVLVDDLTASDYLISMGIANDVSFEKSLENTVSYIDMYDFSIDAPPEPVRNSEFFKEKIGSSSQHVLERIPEENDGILKIDIEGGEWEFLPSLSVEQLNNFRQIAIEIHWAIDYSFLQVTGMPVEVLEVLNQTHQLVAMHPNNYGSTVLVDGVVVPQVLELTYLRRSSYSFSGVPGNPVVFFMPNNPYAREIVRYL